MINTTNFKCDCKLFKNKEETNQLSRIDLYSFTDSVSSQLFLDIVNKDTEQVSVTTKLKSIKISKSNNNEFEIDQFTFKEDSGEQDSVYRVSFHKLDN